MSYRKGSIIFLLYILISSVFFGCSANTDRLDNLTSTSRWKYLTFKISNVLVSQKQLRFVGKILVKGPSAQVDFETRTLEKGYIALIVEMEFNNQGKEFEITPEDFALIDSTGKRIRPISGGVDLRTDSEVWVGTFPGSTIRSGKTKEKYLFVVKLENLPSSRISFLGEDFTLDKYLQ